MHQVPQWIYITFTAVTAIGVLMQALVLLGMLLALKGALTRLDEVSKLAQEHLIPALSSVRHLFEEVSPKLKVAADNVLEASQTLRSQSQHVNSTVDDLLEKTETQADRIDEMVTAALNSIAHATSTLQRVVATPARQVSAVLNGLRAGLDVLWHKEHEPDVTSNGDRVTPSGIPVGPDAGLGI
jgi:methyl-accepting chemotaxis protein